MSATDSDDADTRPQTPPGPQDPRRAGQTLEMLLGRAPMSAAQRRAIAVLIGLNALDGFDVLAISFASPGIADEWDIDKARLGVVLSMELVGMALGSMTLGSVADAVGRRRTMLSCLVLMSIGMVMVIGVETIAMLSCWRILTGIGIGGMLACSTAAASECANDRHRHLCVSWVAIGYPFGAVVGGSVAAFLLRHFDWRSVFVAGATLTLASIPLVLALVPESVIWLARKRPPGALARINATLARMGHAGLLVLPPRADADAGGSPADIFRGGQALTTVLVTLAYFAHITSFYFLVKWIPKIVVDLGYSPSTGAGVLVLTSLGGTAGGIAFGIATQRLPLKPLILAAMGLSVIFVAAFGVSGDDLGLLKLVCALAGFFTNAGVVGMYATFAHTFPTHCRAFGTGVGIGVGRGGAIVAPIIAGILLEADVPVALVAALMASGSMIAAAALAPVRYRRAPAAD